MRLCSPLQKNGRFSKAILRDIVYPVSLYTDHVPVPNDAPVPICASFIEPLYDGYDGGHGMNIGNRVVNRIRHEEPFHALYIAMGHCRNAIGTNAHRKDPPETLKQIYCRRIII